MTTSPSLPVHFSESYFDHAERLQVSLAWVVRRRAVLAARLAERELPHFTAKHLRMAAVDMLMQTLAVQPAMTGSGTSPILLVPVVIVPTDDLLRGRRTWWRAQRAHSWRLPETEPPLMRRLPYGYCWGANGAIYPDGASAPVVHQAFTLIVRLGRAGNRSPWEDVAAALNAADHRSPRGRDWLASEVRDLTRQPEYAGYEQQFRADGGVLVRPLSGLSAPLVPLPTFLTAARLRQRKPPAWLRDLAALSTATEQQEVGHLLPPAGRITERTHATAT